MLLRHSLAVLACVASIAPATAQEFDCVIEARQSVDVRSNAEGVIETVAVNRGETVKKGQRIRVKTRAGALGFEWQASPPVVETDTGTLAGD